MSEYQRWGGTDKYGFMCEGLCMWTEEQMWRQVSVCALRRKHVFVQSRFPQKENQDQPLQEKLKLHLLNVIYVTEHSDALINNITMWQICLTSLQCLYPLKLLLRKVGVKCRTSCCSTENPLSSPLAGLKWKIEIIPPYALLPWKTDCGFYLLGSPSASNSFPMSCSYDVPTVALLLPAATVRWYSQVF